VGAPRLGTARLVMRGWTSPDRDVFAAMNADPEVMEHFPATMPRDESDAFVDRIERGFDAHGFGLWALELRESGEFVGFTGLSVPRFHADWMDQREQPVVEVGWRLVRSAWGKGLASEAAREACRFGFEEVGRREITSFTVVGNLRSQAVMRRLGMTPIAEYDHPVVGHAPLPSVAFLLTRQAYTSVCGSLGRCPTSPART
jgi:RimJ/RimL family protein N-acetyltransferase